MLAVQALARLIAAAQVIRRPDDGRGREGPFHWPVVTCRSFLSILILETSTRRGRSRTYQRYDTASLNIRIVRFGGGEGGGVTLSD